MTKKLKRAVIKEELVELTGDFISAVALNQFLYWSERVKDVDLYIQEERGRDPDVSIDLAHGWIYKTATDLQAEIMVTTSTQTLRRRIDDLVECGWLDRRRNPEFPWDKTYQYRPNIRKIQADLAALGYYGASEPRLLLDLDDYERIADKPFPDDPAVFMVAQRETKTEARPGYIYVLEGGGYHKIGMSRNLPTKRVYEFAPKLPFPTEIVYSFPVADRYEAEGELHKKFADKRAHGEWFELDQVDLDYLERRGNE